MRRHIVVLFLIVNTFPVSRLVSQDSREQIVASSIENGVVVYEANDGSKLTLFVDSPKLQMLFAPHLKGILEIVESQDASIAELRQESAERLVAQLFKPDGSAELLTVSEAKSIEEKVYYEFERNIETKVLMPDQLDLLKNYPQFLSISRNGLLSFILSGGGGKISISENQKQDLMEKSKRLKAKLLKQMKDLESSVINELIADMSLDQRKLIDDFRGKFDDANRVPNLARLYSTLGGDCCSDDRSENSSQSNWTILLPTLAPGNDK